MNKDNIRECVVFYLKEIFDEEPCSEIVDEVLQMVEDSRLIVVEENVYEIIHRVYEDN